MKIRPTAVAAGILLLASALPGNVSAQHSHARLGPVGVSVPFGFGGDQVRPGASVELAVSMGVGNAGSVGLYTRLSEQRMETEGSAGLWAIGLEVRRAFLVHAPGRNPLAEGEEMPLRTVIPVVGVRAGLASRTDAERMDAGEWHHSRGFEIGPLVGAQYRIWRHLGVDMALNLPVGIIAGTGGTVPTLQASVVLTW